MPVTKAQIQATKKYQKENYEEIKIRVQKGEKEKIKEFTKNKGMSLNNYIVELIKKDMEGSE